MTISWGIFLVIGLSVSVIVLYIIIRPTDKQQIELSPFLATTFILICYINLY